MNGVDKQGRFLAIGRYAFMIQRFGRRRMIRGTPIGVDSDSMFFSGREGEGQVEHQRRSLKFALDHRIGRRARSKWPAPGEHAMLASTLIFS